MLFHLAFYVGYALSHLTSPNNYFFTVENLVMNQNNRSLECLHSSQSNVMAYPPCFLIYIAKLHYLPKVILASNQKLPEIIIYKS